MSLGRLWVKNVLAELITLTKKSPNEKRLFLNSKTTQVYNKTALNVDFNDPVVLYDARTYTVVSYIDYSV